MRLAAYGCALDGAALPVAVQRKAATCLLDYLSACLSARELPWSRQAVARTVALGARGEATIIGTCARSAASEAAFANATTGHGLVREDMHVGSACHIGVVVIPAALAMAERAAGKGADLLAGIVAGYEVMARVGTALLSNAFASRFRPTGTVGPLGAAMAAARSAGFDAAVASNALALAGNLGAGLNEWPRCGGSEVFFHAGHAARAGIVAVELAALGAEASDTIIEGEGGMLAAFGADPGRGDDIVAGLGERHAILDVKHKPAPGCNFAQTPALAAEALARRGEYRPQQVRKVTVHSFGNAIAYPGCDRATRCTSVLEAKMSIQYCVAATLVAGAFDEACFQRLEDEQVRRIAASTTLRADPVLQQAFPARQGAAIEVELDDGRCLQAALDDVSWLDEEGARRRFRAEAGAALGNETAAAIESSADRLPALDDVGELVALLAKADDGSGEAMA
jgi:2-methylcitrate dehydratase PrpD